MTSAQRGEGVPSKADIVIKLSKGGCVNFRTRGEGVKKSENFAGIICTCPLRIKTKLGHGRKGNETTHGGM